MTTEPCYLITPTLLNSFLWLQGAKGDWKEKAEQDFYKTIHKIKTLDNPSFNKGIEFEALIEKATQGLDVETQEVVHLSEVSREKLNQVVRELTTIVQDGQWQAKTKKIITGKNGATYLLYGRLDVLKPSIIYDIKYSAKKKPNKFRSSAQHRLYMHCLDIDRFTYLISNGETWWREDYRRDSVYDPQFLLNVIEELKTHLAKDTELLNVFNEKWQAN